MTLQSKILKQNTTPETENSSAATVSFESFGLSEKLIKAVYEQGYTKPTPIQVQAIPVVLEGGDLLASAQTGTGKTAGFVLPMLQRLSCDNSKVRSAQGGIAVRGLILTPTRELASQVEESVRLYGKHHGLSSAAIFGGVSLKPQIKLLQRGVDILVATPGRLLDLVGQGVLDLHHVKIFVLDEADRMLDMGFIHDIKKILAVLPKQKQSLLFSATFSAEIKTLAERLLNKPKTVEVARLNKTADTIGQKVYRVARAKKRDLLIHLIKTEKWQQVLVFMRTKHGANKLVEHLLKAGINAMAIHGNKSQAARTNALSEFKAGTLTVLCATDIAARGIDIDQLPHVVNYELPNVPEDYVHRIGRTGRAGVQGEAVSLVCLDEDVFLRNIEKLIKFDIPKETIDGFGPDPDEKPEPVALGRTMANMNSRKPRTGNGPSKTGGSAKPRKFVDSRSKKH